MTDIYTSCMNRVNKALSKLKWESAFKAKSSQWMQTGVARQLALHAMLNNPSKQSPTEMAVNPEVLTPVLDSIKRLSSSIGSGRVSVIGRMEDMTLFDWLKLEAILLKERLGSSEHKYPLHENLATNPRFIKADSNIPAIIGQYQQPCLKVLAIFIGTFLVSIGALNYLASATHVALSVDIGIAMSIVVSSITTCSVGILTGLRESLQTSHAMSTTAAGGVSSTWEDVFALKTQTDAILVGMLIDICDTALTKNLEFKLPDLMALPPSTAFKLAARLFKDNGYVYSSLNDRLTRIGAVPAAPPKASQRPQNTGPTYLGYTFDALAETTNPVELGQPSQAPVPQTVREFAHRHQDPI